MSERPVLGRYVPEPVWQEIRAYLANRPAGESYRRDQHGQPIELWQLYHELSQCRPLTQESEESQESQEPKP